MIQYIYLLATTALLLKQVLFPNLFIHAYAPYFAYLFLQKRSKGTVLWISALIGGELDLLSSHPFGLFATSSTCCALLLHPFRTYFSEDNPLHIALYTAWISATFTLLSALFLFDRRFPFTGQWFLTDIVGGSLIDALYGILWIFFPVTFGKWTLLWLKKKKGFPLLH